MNRYLLRFVLVISGILISFAFAGLATAQPKHRYFLSANSLLETQTETPAVDGGPIEEETARPRKVELGTNYFKDFLHDFYHVLSSPVRWDTADWITASLVVATTGAFISLDSEIEKLVQRNRTTTTDDIAKVAKPFGDGFYLVSGMGIAYGLGSLIKNDKLKRVSLLSFESFAISGVLTTAIKSLAGRDRPPRTDGPYDWDGLSIRDNSFPSGHTTAAFAVATTLAEEFKDSAWIPPLSFGIAILTGLSRLNDDAHWASDVFLGGAIGYFTAKTVVKLHTNPLSSRLIIYPATTGRVTTLNFMYLF